MNSKRFQLMTMLAMVGVGFPAPEGEIPVRVSLPPPPPDPRRRAPAELRRDPGGISISMEPVDLTKLSRQQRRALSRRDAKRRLRSQGRG